uniref:Autophagy-related protein 13 N-terminal domain-containing protein n=1 Tax=Leersia perrieri TaxID=77586 RepID=A0A0D9W7M9_9ORYZ
MSGMSDSGTGGGGRGGAELMAKQFHLKVVHAVLAVRAPRPLQPAASASFSRRDRWFHLPLHDPPPPPAAEEVEAPAPASGEPLGEGIAVNRAYNRCMTVLRSVYGALRFLPAYRVFRLLCANKSYNYEMVHRAGTIAEPLTRDEEAAMRSYTFAPVETQPGRLIVSVQYLPSLAAFNFEISSLSPSMLIPDYVGSPAAEPMRAFPASLTEAAGSAFPLSNQPQRRHSWAPAAFWPQARHSPPQLFNASPTPSPPNFPSGYLQPRHKGGTAPMSIPQIGGRRSPGRRQIMLEPSKGSTLPPPSPRRVGETGTGSSQHSPSEINRSFGRADGLRLMDTYGSLSPGRKGKDSKDESGRFSALSSCDSPRRDDIDDADYPFVVDDVDTPSSQPGGGDGKETRDQLSSLSHKSQDAAIGSLVHLLHTARPLRSHASMVESNEAASTSSVVSRKKSDALEVLQSFKEIKESLVSRSIAKQPESPEKPKHQEPPRRP